MTRNIIFGLAATLNVSQAWLARAGRQYLAAAKLINTAVVELHETEGWDACDLRRMGEIQNELIRLLIERGAMRCR